MAERGEILTTEAALIVAKEAQQQLEERNVRSKNGRTYLFVVDGGFEAGFSPATVELEAPAMQRVRVDMAVSLLDLLEKGGTKADLLRLISNG